MTTHYYLLILLVAVLLVPQIAYASSLSGPVDNTTTNGVQIIPSTDGKLLEDQSFLNLNITYWNKTQAIVNNTVLNFAASDEILQFIQEKIAEESQPPEDIEEQEEEQIEDESPSDDGGSGDNNDTPLPPGIDPIEQPFPPIDGPGNGSGDGGDEGDEGGGGA